MTKKFKVHIGFITSDGVRIVPGEYDGTEFDVAEARRRSYITNVLPGSKDSPVEIEHKITDDVLTKVKMGVESGDLPTITLRQTQELLVPKAIKINYATVAELIELKYVGKKTAERVVELRDVEWFDNYGDLNRRVALQGSRVWEDVAYMDFAHPIKQDVNQLQVSISDTGSRYNAEPKQSSK
jgi:hypothetical protein